MKNLIRIFNLPLLYCYCLVVFMMFTCTAFSQSNIKGRVINKIDKKPLSNVNVFLSNATIGTKTNADGTFQLDRVKPGNYNLVVSMVGFETYFYALAINESDIDLGDIKITPKTIRLAEVTVKPHTDDDRDKYLELFRPIFLGTLEWASQCKIVNPETIDFDYDDKTGELKASSSDFIIVLNKALGYKVKYLLTDFQVDKNREDIQFNGFVLFEEMKGSPSEERQWLRNRKEVYVGSPMHFFRSLLTDELENQGFRILQYTTNQNPNRPPDSVINSKIEHYKNLKSKKSKWKDSLAWWEKKVPLPKTYKKLMNFPLRRDEILRRTDKESVYAFGCEFDDVYIEYNKNHHFHEDDRDIKLNDAFNHETTRISFPVLYAFFDYNGWLINPWSMALSGAWGKYRVAGMLPSNYEPAN